jgi:hypothetical protein
MVRGSVTIERNGFDFDGFSEECFGYGHVALGAEQEAYCIR